MILEIALGIVLAVLILIFWPLILGLGVILLVVAVVLIAVGLLVIFAAKDFLGFGIIAALLGATFLVTWFTRVKPEANRRRALGYDGGVESPSDGDITGEEQRRRSLGYGTSAEGIGKRK